MVDRVIGTIPSQGHVKWHPRMTPFRILVLVITIGLGTAKAVATQRGNTLLPITLEWITGVLVFLFLDLCSFYDPEERSRHAPKYVRWMFTLDCMDGIWLALSWVSLPHPRYHSNERSEDAIDITMAPSFPPLTMYQMVIYGSVISFGSWKAMLGYKDDNSGGTSSASGWVDWALGVGATTIFYCLGLYENSEPNIWPEFFVKDYRHIIFSTLWRTVLRCLGLAQTPLFLYVLFKLWHPAKPGSETLLDSALDLFTKLWLTLIILPGFFVWSHLSVEILGPAIPTFRRVRSRLPDLDITTSPWIPQLNPSIQLRASHFVRTSCIALLVVVGVCSPVIGLIGLCASFIELWTEISDFQHWMLTFHSSMLCVLCGLFLLFALILGIARGSI